MVPLAFLSSGDIAEVIQLNDKSTISGDKKKNQPHFYRVEEFGLRPGKGIKVIRNGSGNSMSSW